MDMMNTALDTWLAKYATMLHTFPVHKHRQLSNNATHDAIKIITEAAETLGKRTLKRNSI